MAKNLQQNHQIGLLIQCADAWPLGEFRFVQILAGGLESFAKSWGLPGSRDVHAWN